MPVSSLPSDCGIGTLGAGAYAFVDWLHSAGMRTWQVLPLLPTGYGDSPYQSCASDGLNYYFIDFALLVKDGLLTEEEYQSISWSEDLRRVDYGKQFEYKKPLLQKAYERFDKQDQAWKAFLREGEYADFALFMTLKNKFDYAPWQAWDMPYKQGQASAEFLQENREEIEFWQFTQYLFLKQWSALKAYANAKGIEIMGDMPIYVSSDSVETWKYGEKLFLMDGEGNQTLRAGVPPDAFSDEGQLWGNPLYDWAKMKEDGYAWWKARFAYAFTLFDVLRIDHFRAFDRYYAIPSTAETAKEGEWKDGPKAALFKGMKNAAIVAEDLGIIDDGVRALLKKTGYPGMKVFEFAFDGNPENDYLPSNFGRNCVVYTGTHDNEPLRAFIETMDAPTRKRFKKELEKQCLLFDVPCIVETIEDECKTIIQLLFASKANRVIVPMQDVLFMGVESRLNAPSTLSGDNWTFRFLESDFKRGKAAWLKEMAVEYNR